MSVVVIIKFPGAKVAAFTEVFDRNTETMNGISADARSKGAIHHQFVEDENGDVMVIDEWESMEQFEGFFAGQEEIKRITSEIRPTGQPSAVSYRVLDTPDRF